MTDIFACSMAKKSSSVVRMENDADIFADSMIKKSNSVLVNSKSERVA